MLATDNAIISRFDKLIIAMTDGEPHTTAQKKPSFGQALDEAHGACCSDTQTHLDTSQDASG